MAVIKCFFHNQLSCDFFPSLIIWLIKWQQTNLTVTSSNVLLFQPAVHNTNILSLKSDKTTVPLYKRTQNDSSIINLNWDKFSDLWLFAHFKSHKTDHIVWTIVGGFNSWKTFYCFMWKYIYYICDCYLYYSPPLLASATQKLLSSDIYQSIEVILIIDHIF